MWLTVEVNEMRRTSLLIVFVLMFALTLVACGGGGDAEPAPAGDVTGDATRGEELYKQTTIGAASAPGCITCHSLEADVVLVGPSHVGVATRAETAVSGQSAEAYLRESIVDPNAHVTEGFTEGVMYQNYGSDLSEQEISDLVAYLLTQK
jgi:cytochrome c553